MNRNISAEIIAYIQEIMLNDQTTPDNYRDDCGDLASLIRIGQIDFLELVGQRYKSKTCDKKRHKSKTCAMIGIIEINKSLYTYRL